MYCGGDELNAIVCDVGSLRSRMGFAGEDDARYIGMPGDDSDMNGIMTADGVVQSYDALEASLDAGFARLAVDAPRQHPILWSESNFQPPPSSSSDEDPSSTSKCDREAIAELFFEKYDVPAYFVSKSAVLTCFANGRSTGLVVEMGHGGTSVVPVQEGYVLGHHASRHATGGAALNRFLRTRVDEKRKPDAAPLSWSCIRDIKASICRASEAPFDEKANAQIPQMPYELPDGTQIALGVERFSVAEHYFHYDKQPDDVPGLFLPGLVVDAASRGDADTKKELLHNVVVAGGASCFESLPTRLERELSTLVPSAKPKVVAGQPTERKLSAFLGGSILGSLGSFHEMWISKTEYAEHGASLVQKKCP
ncbi:Aste57867_1904 [Aphanomyces stellatus]|uniref:Aste57867_1904 protein n=1 Tax=Aphanomyces stellatus TaxID=120398 RepID=A0A485K8X5_9STRA|nr:hypothetical protein As57867_001902 [Aphanomyces stellatus]VFT79111.1 Aste57867_1904 [Aphanomyces stellatus]